jgi:hypothetical protein
MGSSVNGEVPPDEYITCLHRGKTDFGFFRSGQAGDCSVCVEDDDNRFCKLYIPVRVYKFYVEFLHTKEQE